MGEGQNGVEGGEACGWPAQGGRRSQETAFGPEPNPVPGGPNLAACSCGTNFSNAASSSPI